MCSWCLDVEPKDLVLYRMVGLTRCFTPEIAFRNGVPVLRPQVFFQPLPFPWLPWLHNSATFGNFAEISRAIDTAIVFPQFCQ
jgi:hypothetical protein